jgi:hypothetical protein
MNKEKAPVKKIQVNFFAPYEILVSAEELARPLELAQLGDEIARAWLLELERRAQTGKAKIDKAISPDNLDTSKLSAYPLLLTPSILGELTNAAVKENVEPMTWGAVLLSTWQSDRLASYEKQIPLLERVRKDSLEFQPRFPTPRKHRPHSF